MSETSCDVAVSNVQDRFFLSFRDRYELLVPNIYLDNHSCEMDMFCIRKSGLCDEIEIKMSKSDYLADFKKMVRIYELKNDGKRRWSTRILEEKHTAIEQGMMAPNYFSFLMSEDLAEKCDIPDYAGLYTYRVLDSGITFITQKKTSPLLHRSKISLESKYKIAKKAAMRRWYNIL